MATYVSGLTSGVKIYYDAVLFECVAALLGVSGERKMSDEDVLVGLEEIRTVICWHE